MPVYLDCAATTPVDPRVRDEVLRVLAEDYGNAGSRTHRLGQRARAAVERARDAVSSLLSAARGDVVFTSGATESNNLALLGLAPHAEATGRRHIVSTLIEHHAVLEPLNALQRRGFEVDLVSPGPDGVIRADSIARALRPETLAVSVMYVNNETGMIQPIAEIAAGLERHEAFFHVDAAQAFSGAPLGPLRHPRVDLISVSGHKLHAPQGIGALISRKRGAVRPPLSPLMFGGGQERALRPGTQPVHLIAALGLAASLADEEHDTRADRCRGFRERLLEGLAPLEPVVTGDARHAAPHILSLAFPGLEAERVIEAWRELVAISQGAACTSQSYTCSHVLGAMRLPEWQQEGAVRLSWCYATPFPDVSAMVEALQRERRAVEQTR